MKRTAQGDLLRRMKLNRKRLSSKMYRAPGVFQRNPSWPGDWEGRCILALSSLYFAFNGHPEEQASLRAQLDEIMNDLKSHLNPEGYFGDPVCDSFVNEQQVSGNSWFLRGLIEYYQISHDEKIRLMIKDVVTNFIFRIAKFYTHYPLSSREMGGVDGHIEGKVTDGWLTSSDVGCAFIMMDAMSEAYYLLRDERLKQILEEVIGVFLKLDFVSLKCQTHATLSCARGILTFYRASGEKKYLEAAISIFDRYLGEGMTLDYSNYNWFQKPETWTEPCCIVDSLLLAGQLYPITGQAKYLTLLNRIYLNSFRMAQRSNGGAGCNTCLTHEHPEVKNYLYEAYFCCTMRFAEGLRFAKKYASFFDSDSVLVALPIAQDLELCDGRSLSITGDLYSKKRLCFEAKGGKSIPIRLHVPSTLVFHADFPCSYENEEIRFELNSGEKKEIRFELVPHEEEGLHFVGDMLLVQRNEYPDHTNFLVGGKTYYYLADYSKIKGKERVSHLVQSL